MLIKSLEEIAARILQNTSGIFPQQKRKIELVEKAFKPAARVERDFEEWCKSVVSECPRYPIAAYLKVVDSRLREIQIVQQQEAPKDSRVDAISALTYKLTRRPAPPKPVRELLKLYTVEEITSALTEYAEGLDDRELSWAPRAFFVENGGEAIILARRGRFAEAEQQFRQEQAEKNYLNELAEGTQREADERARQRESAAKEIKNPSAEELFG